MEKVEVSLNQRPLGYEVRSKRGKYLKFCKTIYIAEMILEHKVFFLVSKGRTITSEEKCLLGEFHYREIAKKLLSDAGQILMRDRLKNATIVNRKVDYDKDEKIYSIIFSSNLQVRVSARHWPLFKSRPLLKESTLIVTQTALNV